MTLIWFPQMFNLQVVKLYCMCLRTMKLWLKWLWKAEVQQWDMFPELIELLLIGCSIELTWTQESKSNTSTPRINLQISWQWGISHVMNGIILLTLFNISHFSSTSCIAEMAKRAQQESGEGRVTAKSRPMMNLTARTPSFVSSSASSNPGDLVWISRSWKTCSWR